MDDMKAAQSPQDRLQRTQHQEIEPVDKNVNDTNRIVLVDPILQALRKQRALSSILALNEALHLIPRISRGNPNSRITPDAAFSHSLGHERRFRDVRDKSGLRQTLERLRYRSEPTLRANGLNRLRGRMLRSRFE